MMRPSWHICGADRRRGVAMLIGIMILAALFFMALPFAVYMRQQHTSATQALQSTRARYGESGAIAHAKGVLYNNYRKNDPFVAPTLPFPWKVTGVDSAWQYHVTLRTTTLNAIPLPSGLPTQFRVGNGLGWPNDGDPTTVDGYVRVEEPGGANVEWMAYSDVVLDAPGVGSTFPNATITIQDETPALAQGSRGLFGTSVPTAAHPAGSVVSFFPASELWSLDIQDQQALINVNTAPYQVILNLLGYLHIGGNGPADVATGDPLKDFPTARQVSMALAIATYKTQRSVWPGGLAAYTPFENVDMVKNICLYPYWGGAQPLTADEFDRMRPYITVNSATFGNIAWPTIGGLQDDTTRTTRYALNLTGAAQVAVGSVVCISSTSAPFTTDYATVLAKSGDDTTLSVAFNTGDPQMHLAWMPGYLATVQTPGYVQIGTEYFEFTNAVHVTGPPDEVVLTISKEGALNGGPAMPRPIPVGTSADGNIISWVSTTGIAAPLANDYTAAGTPNVTVQERNYVNINTVTNETVLKSLINGVSDGVITVADVAPTNQATQVARQLLNLTSGEIYPANWGFLDGNEKWFDDGSATPTNRLDTYLYNGATSQLETDVPGLVAGTGKLLHDNFSPSVPGSWPANSTMPIYTSSGSFAGIDSLATVDDAAGTPTAQSPRSDGLVVSRVYSIVPPLAPVWWNLRTQQEFADDILAGNSKNVRTAVLNDALPAAALSADAKKRYTRPDLGLGTARPELGETNSTIFTTVLQGLHNTGIGGPPPSFALDYGRSLVTAEASGAVPGVLNTSDGGLTNVSLQYQTDYAQNLCANRNIQADSFQATIQPFAFEAWVKMPTDKDYTGADLSIKAGSGAYVLVDVGAGQIADAAVDQARLYFEWASGVGEKLRLNLRLDDETGTGYAVASSSDDFTFAAGCWYHVAVAAEGTFSSEIAMVIDGIYDKNMKWAFHYGGASDDATAAQGAYFWPVAMPVPNKQYHVPAGPGPNGEWAAGYGYLPLTSYAGLPARGMVVVHHHGPLGVNVTHIYEYDSIVAQGLHLIPTGLAATADSTSTAACMIPVVRTTVHQAAPGLNAAPRKDDAVRFYEHAKLSANPGGYDSWGHPGGAAPVFHTATVLDVGTMTDPVDPLHPLAQYTWLAFEPENYTQGATADRIFDPVTGDIYPGEGGFFDPTARRWKVLNAAAGTLSGELPCYPGATFRIGGPATGGNGANFTGDLDEVRISVLPVALPYTGVITAPADWSAGPSFNVETWAWAPDLIFGTRAERVPGPRLDLADELTTRKLFDGGFFMVEGDLYDFNTFAGSIVGGVALDSPDLTSTLGPVPAQTHEMLKRIVPLNFVTSTRLAGGIVAVDTVIALADVSAFPANGYVKMDGEIMAYNVRDGALNTISTTSEAYRRGCYNTAAAAHNAATKVWLMPVRELDRYKVTNVAGWDNHVSYTAGVVSAATDMSMLSWLIPNSAGGQVSNVTWTLKDPLVNGQKVAVLVNLDTATLDWGLNPADGPSDMVSTDKLWGTIMTTGGIPPPPPLFLLTSAGAQPVAVTNVEIRVYFDLSGANVYNHIYSGGAVSSVPSKPLELDSLGMQLVPKPATF